MRKIAVVLAVLFTVVSVGHAARTVRVKGSTNRKTGTYTPSHSRTAPNSSRYDNWSTKGNTNPYTGKRGSKDPFK